MEYKIYEKTSDDNQLLYVYKDMDREVPLNSLYSPRKEVERFIKKLSGVKGKLLIFIGFGNGSLLEVLLDDQIYKENVHFLFIEPFPELKISQNHKDIFQEVQKLSYINIEDFSSLLFAKFISKFISVPVEIKIHPNYSRVNQAKIKECLQIIEEGIQTKQILNNTESKFAVDWIVEPLLNTQNILRSINLKELQGRFAGERAMLVASGPSLKFNIDYIKKNKDSFHIFSVGSALRALSENEIQPDFVLSVDASDRNYETHFKGIDYKGNLIYETMSNSNIQNNHRGPLVVSRSLSDYVSPRTFKNLYSFPQASPSVAIYTLQVIAFLGFSEVYMVGQDLALINGEYYSKGIKHHEGMKDLKAELYVESNKGESIGTTRSLKIFLDSFEALVKTLPKNMKLYNLSESGAKIDGVPYISTDSISVGAKNNITIDCINLMSASKDTNTILIEFIQELEILKREVEIAEKGLERILKLGVVSADDMGKVVKRFRNVSKHKILEEIILSQLTYMFDSIINKLVYFEKKQRYTSDDLLIFVKELNSFYKLVSSFVKDLLINERLL
ncbi:6-hydroxymethylpterin diphosphokinase MptE-like protein [Mesobacillus jeotgali]|uniref:DUF115 domain-containing protein n=1 Tax=Mesobacillus jeotgali TaxID=129985 RepID=A0ABY9VFL0_9BACI|nr:6-hydroxymethylpterin diphosphokinase MptE-like protein [Mesobacillus jeotgali]WNF22610.1 DUF115 domain-containing protein [Mesobacillus jeotgali]